MFLSHARPWQTRESQGICDDDHNSEQYCGNEQRVPRERIERSKHRHTLDGTTTTIPERLRPETVLDGLEQPITGEQTLGTTHSLWHGRISQQGCLCHSL